MATKRKKTTSKVAPLVDPALLEAELLRKIVAVAKYRDWWERSRGELKVESLGERWFAHLEPLVRDARMRAGRVDELMPAYQVCLELYELYERITDKSDPKLQLAELERIWSTWKIEELTGHTLERFKQFAFKTRQQIKERVGSYEGGSKSCAFNVTGQIFWHGSEKKTEAVGAELIQMAFTDFDPLRVKMTESEKAFMAIIIRRLLEVYPADNTALESLQAKIDSKKEKLDAASMKKTDDLISEFASKLPPIMAEELKKEIEQIELQIKKP